MGNIWQWSNDWSSYLKEDISNIIKEIKIINNNKNYRTKKEYKT